MPARRPVLAIGIDAADGRLVRRLADEGRLPAIARLASTGRWGRVSSPAPIGSGAVWPTFITGIGPDGHGLFGEYRWNAGTMSLERPTFDHLTPFWKLLARTGRTVAVLDVPFAPAVGLPGVAEIANWGAHDWLGDRTVIYPPELERRLGDPLARRHPLAAGPVDSAGPHDIDGLRHVVRSCIRGAQQRGELVRRLFDAVGPDLLIAVFTEAHRASHLLWHTIDEGHPAWQELRLSIPQDVMTGLVDTLVAIDEQIGQIVAHAGSDASIVVFALHGMQPARGIPALLSDVLTRWGFSTERPWWRRSAAEHVESLAQSAKKRMPRTLKNAYYRRVPKSITMHLAQPSIPVRAWDWRRTRAVALPTDQHGWIRLNLAGREAKGSVPSSAYAATCRQLADRLRTLSSPEGCLVRDVVMTATEIGHPPQLLPDLVVHWTPLTWRPRIRVVDPLLDSTSVGLKFVGQHDDDGFYVGRGSGIQDWPAVVRTVDLGCLLGEAIEGARSAPA